MAKNLIIVESPAKVKTIGKFLGKEYDVQASVGHIRDLPSNILGVDENNNFAPKYEIMKGKEKIVKNLCEAAKKADKIYLAPDPDREGEAIAWHIATLIGKNNNNIQRIQFNEITPKAVKEALLNPRELNENLFDAQQARRILDRLVGYKISPLLWNKVKRGISAGRVQSVALRIIVDRDKERAVFVPEEYWVFKAFFEGKEPIIFRTDLYKVANKKPKISNEKEALELENRIKNSSFYVDNVEKKEKERTPPPPFITSTLQQAANQRHNYGAKRTMGIAQKLYEGVSLGSSGTTALITYMRTDSVRISDDARDAAKSYIEKRWGGEYYPKKARFFKTKGAAQDAHEAIRPVDVNIDPEEIKHLLLPEQYNLYKLIWNRFLASQMAGMVVEDTVVTIQGEDVVFRAKGERIIFPGFAILTPQKNEDDVELPLLSNGDKLALNKLDKEQKFTQPPPRYTEASLVKELEDKGIGRPSTYASIISTLVDREYVVLQDKVFTATDLGKIVCELLTDNFSELMDVDFTANMENSLDNVAEGKENWINLLKNFYQRFIPALENASKNMASVKSGVSAGIKCPECGKDLVIKFGKAGSFLACSGYPDCTFTSDFSRDEDGVVTPIKKEKPAAEVVGTCPECGKDLVIKHARTGSKFIACTGYPNCKHAEPYSTKLTCPRCEVGELVEKSSKRGKIFYSCSTYPKCDYAMWDEPLKGPCPKCNFPILALHKARGGRVEVVCPKAGCGYKASDE